MQLAPFVVCPETLGPLTPRADGFWSENAQRLYPVHREMVFMGYPAKDATMIAETMVEERDTQGVATPEVMAANLAFARTSARYAVDVINIALRFVDARPVKALELGAGSGAASWLLAEAGCEVWLCDFEAYSMDRGRRIYEHERIGPGHRFVTDARYAPFTDETFDLVLLKEFVHHVADFRPLFAEANRVLKVGGILAFMEPVRSVWQAIRERWRPDPHKGHRITWRSSYMNGLGGTGFSPVHETAIFHNTARGTAVSLLRRHAQWTTRGMRPAGLVSRAHMQLGGGSSLVVVARKTRTCAPPTRPSMLVVDPDTLIPTDEVAAYAENQKVFRDASRRLVRI